MTASTTTLSNGAHAAIVRVEAVSEAHLPALRALFEAAACPCYCRYWHFVGTKNDWLDRCAHHPEDNARELEAAVKSGATSGRGLVAVIGEASSLEVLGWLKLTPRDDVPKLRALPVYRSLELPSGVTTYSVGCLLVRPDARGRGIARRLITAAPAFVRDWGGLAVEGYPRRSTEPLHPEEAWQGPERIFMSTGFDVVHDASPYPVYRVAALERREQSTRGDLREDPHGGRSASAKGRSEG